MPASDLAKVEARLRRSPPPGHPTDLRFDGKQAFTVHGSGFPDLSVVPVKFRSQTVDDARPVPRCGIYIVTGAHPDFFLGTLGFADREAELCDALLGVGFMAMSGGPPRILLLYQGGSFNYTGNDPVVLEWNPASQQYVLNEKIVRSLSHPDSIVAMRRQLQHADAGH